MKLTKIEVRNLWQVATFTALGFRPVYRERGNRVFMVAPPRFDERFLTNDENLPSLLRRQAD